MALITCPECGHEVSDKAANCPHCGSPMNNAQNKKYCQHCGELIDKECVVCPKCGKQVESLSTAGQPQVIVNTNNNNSASASATVIHNSPSHYGKPVSKVIYCLLAFFLGGFGIHKFYAGKTGMGILYILFCWTGIPLILSLIDLVIGLLKKSDEYGKIWF